MDSPRQVSLSPMVLLGMAFLIVSCTSVDIFLLTNKTFPPKGSIQEVEIIDRDPPCAHIAIAQLSVDDSASADYRSEQFEILKKAADLGADAVIFSKPEKHIEHGVIYERPVVGSPWGMGSYGYPGWGYGTGFGMGYGAGVALPYDYTVKTLKGIAIRYTDINGPKC